MEMEGSILNTVKKSPNHQSTWQIFCLRAKNFTMYSSPNSCQAADFILFLQIARFDVFLSKKLPAAKRCHFSNLPIHSFTCMDTATLGGVIYGKTVLAKALKKAGIEFNKDEAHSAVYDAEKTAELFCKIVNENTLASRIS